MILLLKLVTIFGTLDAPTGYNTVVNIDENIVYRYSHALLPRRRYITSLVSTLGKIISMPFSFSSIFHRRCQCGPSALFTSIYLSHGRWMAVSREIMQRD